MRVRKIIDHRGYEISDNGDVYSLNYNHTGKRKALKPTYNGTGYLQVHIDGKWLYIHRLVAIHFIPNPELKKTVNHKNSIRDDNKYSNLEWATHSENIIHGMKYGIIKPKCGEGTKAAILNNNLIKEIRFHAECGVTHMNIAEMFNVNQSTITRIINRKTWKHL